MPTDILAMCCQRLSVRSRQPACSVPFHADGQARLDCGAAGRSPHVGGLPICLPADRPCSAWQRCTATRSNKVKRRRSKLDACSLTPRCDACMQRPPDQPDGTLPLATLHDTHIGRDCCNASHTAPAGPHEQSHNAHSLAGASTQCGHSVRPLLKRLGSPATSC